MKVGVMGASGYVGGELLRLLITHPKVEATCATSTQYAGEPLHRAHPNLRGFTDLKFSEHDPNEVLSKCDLVFTSVPHGTAVKIVPQLVASGIRIIDMSADYRLGKADDYQKWYGYEHPNRELLGRFVYGSPELYREEISQSRFVSCPGCMAITSILALAPLAKGRLIDAKHVIVDAKIGSSGAGTKPTAGSHHSQRYNVVRPYKPVGHRHTAEIEQELGKLAGEPYQVSMSPHGVNIVRGILCTSHVFPRENISIPELWKLYREFYKGAPFVRFVRDRKGLQRYPDPKTLVGSNFCDIGFEIDERVPRLVVLSASDNLMKGAAGSGVQCMNVMLGYDEKEGLYSPGIHPV